MIAPLSQKYASKIKDYELQYKRGNTAPVRSVGMQSSWNICSFIQQIIPNTYYVPGIVVDTEDVMKQNSPCLWRAFISWRDRELNSKYNTVWEMFSKMIQDNLAGFWV